ncbi:transporter substrate-binding domain-containing protein [Rubrivivax sp. RP6-9]|uniref:transporter substrate-binding domain-containing protein n=1 Tax=Rubrivivax sp. RP6-9 TaxID=3415750 RepID=UPI003CC69C96
MAAAAAVALLALAALAGWWQRDASLQRVRDAGVLRIGYAVAPPYAWVGDDGTVRGESPESARVVAARLGLPRVEWVQVGFAELVPGLLERRYDLVASGLFVSPQRAQQVGFADPLVRAVPGLLVRRGNPLALHAYADVRAGAARVAVIDGSVAQARLLALGVPAERLLTVPDPQTGRLAVERGHADALALSLPALAWMARSVPGMLEALELGATPAADSHDVAVAFHPDDRALRAAWNAAQAGWGGSAEHRRVVHGLGFVVASAPSAAATASAAASR